MSLLLDALKPQESDSSAGLEPDASLPLEEPLDGPATLALLVSKPTAPTTLSLVPNSNIAAPPAASPEEFSPDLAEAPHLAKAPHLAESFHPAVIERPAPDLVVELAPAVPKAERASSGAAGRIAEVASAPKPAAAPTANARATVTAPSRPPRARTYALACLALTVLAGIGVLGKSLWWPSTVAFTYPAVREVQQTPSDAVQATTPSAAAVQVPSARPADQFADPGYAPEIDLRSAESPLHAAAPPSATAPAGATATANATVPENAVAAEGATPPPAGETPRASAGRRAARAPSATLSVTRSEGPSPIDRHVQAGYQALAGGNVANAKTEYFAALALDPNNVDALLGAATVAARDGRSKDAAAAYAKVLNLEPGNPDATAALATLGANGSAGVNEESRLKILIASGDDGRPALHAALARVYAADSRWSEAAQEYFTALAKDPGNPDLAFNVAASLDQNRNAGMALAYYGQALIFARQRPTQIDSQAIEQRMSQLQAHMERSTAPETP